MITELDDPPAHGIVPTLGSQVATMGSSLPAAKLGIGVRLFHARDSGQPAIEENHHLVADRPQFPEGADHLFGRPPEEFAVVARGEAHRASRPRRADAPRMASTTANTRTAKSAARAAWVPISRPRKPS